MSKEKCENCKYWKKGAEVSTWFPRDKEKDIPAGRGLRYSDDFGECKRYPEPIIKHKDEWCGEFKLK